MVYPVSEDTILMNTALKELDNTFKLKGKKILEIGCGNCHNINFCVEKQANTFGLDIDKNAKKFCQKNVKFILSNMFKNLKETNFDLIFFNPPYLVSDKIKYVDLDGGNLGREKIDLFLKGFDKFLKPNGKVLLLHTDYNNLSKTKKILKEKGFKMKIIKKEKLFFEELYILLIEPSINKK